MVDVPDRLAELVRVEGGRVLATLVRSVDDWSVAEEAVQEAAIAALRDWAVNGVPNEPRAWLITTARRKAIDILRREQQRRGKEAAGAQLIELRRPDAPEVTELTVLDDDLLRLIFTCCHPSLAPESRLALALRTLGQLSVPQVAAAMLSTEAAVARRLTRTKDKIARAKIPYVTPQPADLPERLAVVCGVIHALYTIGHSPLDGEAAVDVDLCTEAVRLARLLVELMPDEAMPAAVLALFLLTEARRPARVDAAGDVVVLPDQDRGRWHVAMIDEGADRLARSLRRTDGIADPYQLQAAIAFEHDRAPSYPQTDWVEVVRLYDLLLLVAPSPAAALARAVAVAERDGAPAGLKALAALEPNSRVRWVTAELLARDGRLTEAIAVAAPRPDDALTAPEQRQREARRAAWAAADGSTSV
ncbi:MAG TPA: DUF6596 domain-containing protein [Propionibacteriaceae bacterium]